MGFWGNTLAGVASAIVFAALGHLYGFGAAVWAWAKEAAAALAHWLGQTVGVPRWLALLMVAYVLLRLVAAIYQKRGRGYAKRLGRVTTTPAANPIPLTRKPPDAPSTSMSAQEKMVFDQLVTADGWIAFDTLALQLGLARMVIEQALDHLQAKNLIMHKHDALNGSLIRLSVVGRDLAISSGMVRVPYVQG